MIENTRRQSIRLSIIVSVLLAVAVWIVFGQTIRHDFVNFDDDVYVTENAYVATGLTWKSVGWAFGNLEAGFWHPLTWLSLMLDAHFYQQWSGGYHLSNVLLHTLNTVLLFLMLRRLTNSFWPGAVMAALFAVHPLHVESVAWVAQRKDLLSTTFLLLSLWAYARYAQRTEIESPSSGFYWLALLSFACGLMSKTMVVTLPIMMLLLDYWPLRRFEQSTFWRLLNEKLPFFVLALIAGLLTIYAERSVGALTEHDVLPLRVRIANAALSAMHYMRQTVWPADLVVFYPYPKSFPIGPVLLSMLSLLAITVLVLRIRRRHPQVFVGWLWYVVALVPISGLVQVGIHSRADRYAYIPLIGIFFMLSWGLAASFDAKFLPRLISRAATIAILVALTIAAHLQASHWRDSISLWSHALDCLPDNSLAHDSLATALVRKGRLQEAIPHYMRAIELQPDYATAHVNLGIALKEQGRLDEALRLYERALQVKPGCAEAYYNLGVALAAQGKMNEALRCYQQAVHFNPKLAAAHNNLGAALTSLGNPTQAVEHYKQAIRVKPSFTEAYANLGVALVRLRRFDEAIQSYEIALRLKPDFAEAHNNLAGVLTTQGKLNPAIEHGERAVRLKPDYAEAHANLGIAFAKAGRTDEAALQLQHALNLATAQTNPALVETIRQRLNVYQPAQPQPQTP